MLSCAGTLRDRVGMRGNPQRRTRHPRAAGPVASRRLMVTMTYHKMKRSRALLEAAARPLTTRMQRMQDDYLKHLVLQAGRVVAELRAKGSTEGRH
jgi:hypothetical protein